MNLIFLMPSPSRFSLLALCFLCPLLLLGSLADSLAQNSLIKELTPAQLKSLQAGETVLTSKDLPDEAWPELTLYRLVAAKPAEVFELFNDYASAPSYTPGMISAEVVAEPSPNVKDVRYTVRMPVVSRISYIVRNQYNRRGQTYEVSWNLVESPVASASTGSLTIEPYEGKTLLRYRNHVTPSVPMAGMLKGQAAKEARTTIEAIEAEAARRSALAKKN